MVRWYGKHQDWNTRRRTGKSEPIIVEGIHDAIIDEGYGQGYKKLMSSKRIHSLLIEILMETFFNWNTKCPKCGRVLL